MWRRQEIAAFAAVALLAVAEPVRAVAQGPVGAAACSIAAGRDARGNTITCNFGLTDEQLKQATEAAVTGATAPLVAQIRSIGKTLDVTEDAAKSLLKIVGDDPNVPEDKIGEALTKVAGDYKRLQAQAAALNPDNPAARDLVTQAKADIEAGRLGEAHDRLHQATQAQVAAAQQARRLREQAQLAEDRQMLGAASSTAAEAGVALTERHYAQAAELFGEAAGYVPDGHPGERLGYLDRQAAALEQQGDERGDNDALRKAIQLYRQIMAERPRDRVPLAWAATQNALGIALVTLGDRESDPADLEDAVAAYRAALEERTRGRVPLDWAITQNNLGSALETIGERESGTGRLNEAVAAFRAALQELTRDRVPTAWSMVQNNLGNALEALGERESGTVHLSQAIDAYRAALQERTRDRAPSAWAMTQDDLGSALEALGEREDSTVYLHEAIDAYRAALQERTRDRVPLEWAATQDNLGMTLEALGEREGGTARISEAIAAFEAALEERTRDRVPLDWASTQDNLGVALDALGEREGGTEHLDEAVAAFHAALQERTPGRVPLDYAATQCNLGNALAALAKWKGETARLNEAVGAWDACLGITATVWPADWVGDVRDRRGRAELEVQRRAAQ